MVQRRAGDEEVEVRGAAAAAVEVAAEVAGAACLVAMSRAATGAAARETRASDLRQEERRRRREAAQAAQEQSERRARVAEEVHWARVRAAMAAVALRKGGRRWRPSAERAVVRAVRVAGGSGTVANESRNPREAWAQDVTVGEGEKRLFTENMPTQRHNEWSYPLDVMKKRKTRKDQDVSTRECDDLKSEENEQHNKTDADIYFEGAAEEMAK